MTRPDGSALEALRDAGGAERDAGGSVLHYGRPDGEVEDLAARAGLCVRDEWTVLRVRGRDRVDYLHRMTSQDVRALAPGHVAAACVLTARARVLGVPRLWSTSEEILLDFDGRSAPATVAALERYVIGDDVGFEPLAAACFLLAGPAAPGVLGALGLAVPEPGTFRETRLAGTAARVLAWPLGARPAFEWLVPLDRAADAYAALVERPGVSPVGREAVDALRVAEGVAAYGAEIDERVMPLEVGLGDTAISWNKGCYPGQEPVAMARHRGRPPSLLARLAFEGDASIGDELVREGRSAGRLTTVTHHGATDGARALGLVRTAWAEVGARVALADGREVRILSVFH